MNLNGRMDKHGFIKSVCDMTVWSILKDTAFHLERIEYDCDGHTKVKWWLHMDEYIGKDKFRMLATSPLIGNYAKGVRVYQIYDLAVATKIDDIYKAKKSYQNTLAKAIEVSKECGVACSVIDEVNSLFTSPIKDMSKGGLK